MNASVCSGYEAPVQWSARREFLTLATPMRVSRIIASRGILPGLFGSEEELGKTDVKVSVVSLGRQ